MTIAGANLSGATSVSFNGTPAGAVTVTSTGQIVVKVPAGATTGSVTVATAVGTATSVATFTLT